MSVERSYDQREGIARDGVCVNDETHFSELEDDSMSERSTDRYDYDATTETSTDSYSTQDDIVFSCMETKDWLPEGEDGEKEIEKIDEKFLAYFEELHATHQAPIGSSWTLFLNGLASAILRVSKAELELPHNDTPRDPHRFSELITSINEEWAGSRAEKTHTSQTEKSRKTMCPMMEEYLSQVERHEEFWEDGGSKAAVLACLREGALEVRGK